MTGPQLRDICEMFVNNEMPSIIGIWPFLDGVVFLRALTAFARDLRGILSAFSLLSVTI